MLIVLSHFYDFFIIIVYIFTEKFNSDNVKIYFLFIFIYLREYNGKKYKFILKVKIKMFIFLRAEYRDR